jgi:hypothetical protein
MHRGGHERLVKSSDRVKPGLPTPQSVGVHARQSGCNDFFSRGTDVVTDIPDLQGCCVSVPDDVLGIFVAVSRLTDAADTNNGLLVR